VCSYGVAFLHETQSEGEQVVARLLFESGAVQVLVATAPMCWGLTASAHLTVIMGTQVKKWDWRAAAVTFQAAWRVLQLQLPCARVWWPPSPLNHPPLHCTACLPGWLQYYDVTGQGTNDYPVTDLLQMMGRASRPLHDEQGM
jgi:pre-mRNA-splicing helicase BRR2